MEVKGASVLYTLAGLMITFAGFSSLLLALRPAAGARLSLLDRYLAKTVMTFIFVLVAGALLPALLALYELPDQWVWRGAGLVFGCPMLLLQATYPRRRRNVVGSGPPPVVFAVLVVVGVVATMTMLACVLAGCPCRAAVYITALTVDFFTVVFGYLMALEIIMQQPLEVRERTEGEGA